MKSFLKKILRKSFFAYLFAIFIIGYLKKNQSNAPKNRKVRIIFFSSNRFQADLKILKKNSFYEIFEINMKIVSLIDSIFREKKIDYFEYFKLRDKNEILLREKKREYLTKICKVFKFFNFDFLMTCSIQYRIEQDWAFSSHKINLPFIALHKEFTVIDENQFNRQLKKFKFQKRKFLGSKVLVTNNNVKKLFLKAGICDEKKVKVIGLLRSEEYFVDSRKNSNQLDTITLFSFGFLSGGFTTPNQIGHYFSKKKEGFYNLFYNCHGLYAQMALKNPGINFFIKPKNIENEYWVEKIKEAIKLKTNKDLSQINNLSIVPDDAVSLIKKSACIIGFNSTVLLESIALRKPAILPIFDEASSSLKNFIYYKDFFNLFIKIKNKQMFEQKILNILKGQKIKKNSDRNVNKMIETYLGFSDGKCSERLKDELQSMKKDSYI